MRIVLVVFPQVHLLDLTGPAHVYYEAICHGKPYQLIYANAQRGMNAINSSGGLSFNQLADFDQLSLSVGDLIVVPGLEKEVLFDGQFLHKLQPFYRWLRAQNAKGVRICSVCTGAFILGFAGLLNGKYATTHWRYLDHFREKFPLVRIVQNRFFVEDDGIYTSAGVASGIDLALFHLEQLEGAFFAAQIAREVVIYVRRGQEDPQLSIFLKYRNHIEDRIHLVQEWLQSHLDQAFNTADLAARVHVSPRHLTRLFKQTTGITLGKYIEKLRVERGLQLLREGHKLEYAAQQCGLKSSRHLSSLIKANKLELSRKHFKTNPSTHTLKNG